MAHGAAAGKALLAGNGSALQWPAPIQILPSGSRCTAVEQSTRPQTVLPCACRGLPRASIWCVLRFIRSSQTDLNFANRRTSAACYSGRRMGPYALEVAIPSATNNEPAGI
jgi:hypothetical protein